MVEITELDLCRDFPAPDFPVEKIPEEEWRNGLIVRMPNWLGDAVMALPALWQLKKILPENCALGVVAPAGQRAFYHSLPWLDVLIPLVDLHRHWRKDTRRKIRRIKFGAGLLFNNSLRDTIEMRLCGVSPLFGTAARCRGIFLKRSFHFVPPKAGRLRKCHHTNCYLAEAYALGAPRWDGTLPEIRIAQDLVQMPAEVRDLCSHPKMLILGAGAAYGAAKRWSSESYNAVAADWISKGGIVVAVGGPSEKPIGEEIGHGLDPRKYYNMMGKTDLFALMHLLKSAAAAVANDSGVMHLTAALGTPGVAVFGSTDHTSTGPISSSWKLVCTDQPCSPCFCRTCPKKDPKCMKRIEPQTVIRALGMLRIKGVPGEEK
ncbi:MAG: lipopolysaccharide heptosyltransferase II [Lentisphaeria bacterium]|nr:lipopolysaccharide heptosyltransferase II [Lentisphaeria bacterium]